MIGLQSFPLNATKNTILIQNRSLFWLLFLRVKTKDHCHLQAQVSTVNQAVTNCSVSCTLIYFDLRHKLFVPIWAEAAIPRICYFAHGTITVVFPLRSIKGLTSWPWLPERGTRVPNLVANLTIFHSSMLCLQTRLAICTLKERIAKACLCSLSALISCLISAPRFAPPVLSCLYEDAPFTIFIAFTKLVKFHSLPL